MMDAGTEFRARVHRGTKEIGGTCIELESKGQRILLDLGLPLNSELPTDQLLPDVSGLRTYDPSLLAMVISHGHADHWGLVPHTAGEIPYAMGAATRKILHAAAPFVPYPFRPECAYELVDQKTIEIGPFQITAYLVDHSAFDAYALLVESSGRRLFYSGDIRGHGRKGRLFERLISSPPKNVHAMLMEGSSLGRIEADQQFPTESEIEQRLTERFREAKGFIAISASAQNIDRMVSIYRACKRSDRTLLLDLYAMEILRATGNDNIPQPGWPNLALYVPEYQRRQIKRSGRFDLLDAYKAHRLYANDLPTRGQKAVMLFRPAMMMDIDKSGLWSGAHAIWSQWDGYLKDGPGAKLKVELSDRAVPLDLMHTSGHASIRDLKRLSAAISPASLIPIHTFAADSFSEHFTNVVRRNDGEWWGV